MVKIACLGAGSGYFVGALGDLAVTPGLAGSEVTLYDIDQDKGRLMEQYGRRLAALSGTGLRVRACASLADALDGADYAVSAIGGVGESLSSIYQTGYHLHDILIPARYGIHQLIGDTAGPAGMMMALRSIPVYLNICHEMEKRCPQALLINHSNPMAVLCRAMTKYSRIQVIGLCHGVQIGIVYIAKVLGVPPEELGTLWIGTNHYHWFTRIRHRGRDVYPEARARLAALTGEMRQPMTQALSRIYGHAIVYPYDDHAIEFYPYMTQLAGRVLPYGLDGELVKWLGEQGYDRDDARLPAHSPQEVHAARQAQLADYATQLAAIDLPAGPTTSLQGEPLGRLIEALASGRREVYIVNIANRGAVPNLADEAVLEIEAVTDSCGVRGVYMGEAPLALQGLLAKRIVWQELVADAGAKGDRQAALQALLTDEMAIRPEQCEAMLDELLAASKPLLPQFA